MKKSAIAACLGLLLGLAGCVPSLHPLYTEEDLIFDPALLGSWAGRDGKGSWEFSKAGEKEYKLVDLDEQGKKGEFSVHLLKVGDQRFLDLFPLDPELKQNDFYRIHLMPVHTFLRVRQERDSLRVSILNYDWLQKLLKENPGAIKHEVVDDSVLLTAKPKELQAFLLKHEKTAEAWDEGAPMPRVAQKPSK
jgi:hypothetical protein